MISIDRDTLYQLYVVEGMRADDIALQLGMSRTSVYRNLRQYGITPEKKRKGAIPGELIRELYVEQSLSIDEIAQRLRMSHTHVYRYLNANDITKRGVKNPDMPDRETLRQLYVDENLSAGQISKRYGCTPGNIHHYLRFYDIERDRIKRNSQAPDAEQLRKLYVDENLTATQISQRVNLSRSQVFHYLSVYGIDRNKRTPFMTDCDPPLDNDKRFGDFSQGQRRGILKRDHNCCQMCGITGIHLECHHIIPTRFGGRNSIDNGIALCPSCHTTLGWHELQRAEELFCLRGTKTSQAVST